VTPTQPVQLNSAETKIVTVVFVTLALKEMVLFMQIARHVRILMSAKTICTIVVFMHSAITPLALMNVSVSQDFMEMAYHVKISMSAKAIYTIAVFMHTAVTPLVLMIVIVWKDSMEMASHVRMLMSVRIICSIAVFMHSAITPLDPIVVLVSLDSNSMDCRAMTSMNVKRRCTTAMLMHSVKTLSVRTTVTVAQVSWGREGHAMTSMNARMERTSVTQTHNVQTVKALMNAPAILGFAVMVKCAKILTNVWMDHMTAIRMQLVGTLMVPIRVRAMTVSVVMVVFALTSMNAEMKVMSVMLMPAVLTSLVLTAAPAKKATTEMDD